MSEHEGERVGRGCAVFVNLIVSIIILLVLIVLFLPGLVPLPTWVNNFNAGKYLQTRKVLGPVITFNQEDYQESNQLLVVNRRVGRPPIGKILKERKLLKDDILRFNFENKETGNIWEKAFDSIPANDYKTNTLVFDESSVYFITQNQIRAISLQTSQEIWQVNLGEAINPNCQDCLQILEGKQILIVLSQDRVLHALQTRNGNKLWEKQLYDQRSVGQGFSIVDQQIVLLDKESEQADAKSVLAFFDPIQGKRQTDLILPQLSPLAPKYIFDQKLYYLSSLDKASSQIHCVSLVQKKEIWKSNLPEGAIIELNYSLGTNSWIEVDYQYVYLCLSVGEYDQLLRFETSNGNMKTLWNDKNYRFTIRESDRTHLVLQAEGRRGARQPELWFLDKSKPSPDIWQFTLDSKGNSSGNVHQPYPWSTQLKANSELIILIHFPERRELQLQILDLKTQSLKRKENFKVRNAEWSGTTWTRDKVLVVVQAVYAINLNTYQMNIEWP